MPDSSIRVAPDSTGKRIRTRQRTVGGNPVEEQYVLSGSERVVSAHAFVSTFRIPARAVTGQPLFTVWNGGTNLIAVRRLSAEIDTIVAKAVLSPWLRLYRISAAPTTGTTVPLGQQDTAETMSASVVCRCDASADGTSSGTALAATANPAAHLWQQVAPRLHTAVGFVAPAVLSMVPDDGNLSAEAPLILRPSQGLMVRADAPAAPTANDWHYSLKAVLDEFTLP